MAEGGVAERWHGWRWLCHIQGMDTEVDLTTVDRAVLIAIIAELQAVIERLQRRIAELEGQAKPGGPPRMPGLKLDFTHFKRRERERLQLNGAG